MCNVPDNAIGTYPTPRLNTDKSHVTRMQPYDRVDSLIQYAHQRATGKNTTLTTEYELVVRPDRGHTLRSFRARGTWV